MARFTRAKGGAGFDGIMAHVNDGPPCLPPRREQGEGIPVDIIVPALRPGRAIEGLLEIDQQKNGIIQISLESHCLFVSLSAVC